MKAFFLVIGLLTGISKTWSQTNFGIAYYQVPAGFQVIQQSPATILEQQRKDGKTCRIIISATEEMVVNKEELYLRLRNQKSNGGFSYADAGSVDRKENEYSIAFISHSKETVKNKTRKSSFYSFTNNKETFFVQFISEDESCEPAFTYFIKTLEIEEAVTDKMSTGDGKTKMLKKAGGKPRGRPRKNPA